MTTLRAELIDAQHTAVHGRTCGRSSPSVCHNDGATTMILLTRIDGDVIAINCDLVESIDALPFSTVTLVDGVSFEVRESVNEIIDRIREFRASVVTSARQLEQSTNGSAHLRLLSENTNS
jgi:flagellar protein FlbD